MTNPAQEGVMQSLIERRIIAAGEKLAAQLSATFTIDTRRLRDFRIRAKAQQL